MSSSCPRIVKRRDGTKNACGLSATNNVEGVLYCRRCMNLLLKNSSDEENRRRESVSVSAPRALPSSSASSSSSSSELVVNGRVNLNLPDRVMALGQTMSGKSTVIRGILRDLLKTGKVCGIWWFGQNCESETWLPKEHRRVDLDEELLSSIRSMQNTPAFKDRHQVLVFDDVAGETFHGSVFWKEYISHGRHQRLTLIFGLQYVKMVPPVIRENITTYVIAQVSHQTQDALYKIASGCTYGEFKSKFKKLSKGKPMLMDTRAGGKIYNLSYPALEASEMPKVKFM